MQSPNKSRAKESTIDEDVANEIISEMINNISMHEHPTQDLPVGQRLTYILTPDEQVSAQNRSTADQESAFTSTPDEQANTRICHAEKGGSPRPPPSTN